MKNRASYAFIFTFSQMPLSFGSHLTLSVLLFFPVVPGIVQSQSPLFDGKTFAGWESDTNQTWRIEAGAITTGPLDQPAPRNEFLATIREFGNFDLRLKFKIQGTEAFNAGVQFRSKRMPPTSQV